MFSSRLPADAEPNALTRQLAAMRSGGIGVADLTESNPTNAAIPYPAGLLEALADERACRYEPHPLGLRSARRAVAADCARRGARVDPDHIVPTASSSEADPWLFKVLCDPGDSVLVPRPSYPLFEHLTQLEGIGRHPYSLEYHRRWEIDFPSIVTAPPVTKALLVVSPNNPTGSFITRSELEQASKICGDRHWALIADEVFADYPLDATTPVTDLSVNSTSLTFSLGGFSKSLGLPQLKLGWIVVGGPAAIRDRALAALEIVSDTFLSVSTPVQVAAQALFSRAGEVRAAIHGRVRGNLVWLRETAGRFPACDVLTVEGGWSAVIRVPAMGGEERLVLDLLRCERVLTYPGYFFDFPHEAFIVVSLLTPPDVFAEAIPRVLAFASEPRASHPNAGRT